MGCGVWGERFRFGVQVVFRRVHFFGFGGQEVRCRVRVQGIWFQLIVWGFAFEVHGRGSRVQSLRGIVQGVGCTPWSLGGGVEGATTHPHLGCDYAYVAGVPRSYEIAPPP